VFEAEPLARPGEGCRAIARAVIGHDPLDPDTEAFVVGNGGLEEGYGAGFPLALHHPAEGDAGGIIDADMDVLPTDAVMSIDHARMASGDAVPDRADPAEFLDVEMDEFARVLALIAADRLSRLESTQPIDPQAFQDAADGGGGDAEFSGDRLAGQALTAQGFDLDDDRLRSGSIELARPGAAIGKSGRPFDLVTSDPLANGTRADPYGFADGLRGLPAGHQRDNPPSTVRRQVGILVDVHPVLLSWITEASTPSASPGRDRMDNLLKAHS